MLSNHLLRSWRPPFIGLNPEMATFRIAMLFWAATVLCPLVSADSPNALGFGENYKDFSIRSDSSSAELAGPVLQVVADLGSLKSGAQGIATVTIHNPLEHDIPITSARASRSCAVSNHLPKVIPAGGTADLAIALTVPAQDANPDFVGTVTLSVDRTTCQIPTLREVTVTVRCAITGMLSFVQRHVSITVLPDQTKTVHVPFIATIPGVPKSLDVDVTVFLLGVKGSLVQVDEKWFVKFDVGPDDASPDGVFGQLKLTANEHGVNDTIQLALYLESDVQISPRTLRFHPVEDRLEANGTLHFSKTENADQEHVADLSSNEVSPIFCEAFLGGKKLKLQVTSLSENVHRLKLVFDGSDDALQSLTDDPEGRKRIAWNIVVKDKRHSLRSNFTLSR